MLLQIFAFDVCAKGAPMEHDGVAAGKPESSLETERPQVDVPRGDRLKGTVAWFNNVKGFGFLAQEGGPDVFVHFSSIQTDGYRFLKEGEPVEFSIIKGEKGPQADFVVRLDPSPDKHRNAPQDGV